MVFRSRGFERYANIEVVLNRGRGLGKEKNL